MSFGTMLFSDLLAKYLAVADKRGWVAFGKTGVDAACELYAAGETFSLD